MTWLTPKQRQKLYNDAVERCGNDPVFLFPSDAAKADMRKRRLEEETEDKIK